MPDAKPLSRTTESQTLTPPPPPDLTGRTLGDYQILRRIGAGGMGQVYLARQLSLKRDVALKLLRDDMATDPTALKRFQGEAEAVAILNHPNIVHIHQIGEQDGLRYMVLEYVDGRNLRDYLARKGPPDLAVSLSVIRQVALALQKAHEHGIVHRDIKPENILVTRKAEVKVTDFGLSRFFAGETPAANLTQSGVTLGTPLYMSPEQVQGKPVDHRSDIYSFGVTCYHLLAGEPPFRGATAFELAIKHVQEPPPPLAGLRPDLPADLCAMVHKMIAKDPAERYQSVREILRDLAKVREGTTLALNISTGSGTVPPPQFSLTALTTNGTPGRTTVAMTGSHPRRHPLPWGRWAVAVLACIGATVGGVLVYAKMNPPDPPPEPPAPVVGLPEVRLPDKVREKEKGQVVTTRERELLALLDSVNTRPVDVIKGSIELGLLCLRERRLDAADASFKKLEARQFTGFEARPASMTSRLGQAIVLAHRDTTAAAEQSNALVLKVLNEPAPKVGKYEKIDKFDRGYAAMATLLMKHPDLAQGLAEALNRNAATLNKSRLDPAPLELLRYPPKGMKKD